MMQEDRVKAMVF